MKYPKQGNELSKFAKKYRHIGISYPGVSDGWIPIVKKAIVDIERKMWPWWLPRLVCHLIHWLATGNSVVKVKYRWSYKLRQRLTAGQIISCIKEKYAGLRIYGSYNEEIEVLIEHAEIQCRDTCQFCGGPNPRIVNKGWLYNICAACEMEHFK